MVLAKAWVKRENVDGLAWHGLSVVSKSDQTVTKAQPIEPYLLYCISSQKLMLQKLLLTVCLSAVNHGRIPSQAQGPDRRLLFPFLTFSFPCVP